MVGIAERQRALGQAVEAEHQPVRPTVGHPVVADPAREGVDVAGIVVIVLDEAQLRQVAAAHRPGSDRIGNARRRRRRVLGIERQHQYPLDTGRPQRVERTGDRGLAVAHPVPHQDRMAALAEIAGEQQRLLLGPDLERRALLHPDRGVLACRFRRPDPQDEAVQDRQPDEARYLDDARIGEELGEITPHRLGRRLVGRAEVADQDRGLCRDAVGEGGLRREAHRPAPRAIVKASARTRRAPGAGCRRTSSPRSARTGSPARSAACPGRSRRRRARCRRRGAG